MPETYAALLRESSALVRAHCRARQHPCNDCVRVANTLLQLAAVMERVTPEVDRAVYRARAGHMADLNPICDAREIFAALAAGPQPEERDKGQDNA